MPSVPASPIPESLEPWRIAQTLERRRYLGVRLMHLPVVAMAMILGIMLSFHGGNVAAQPRGQSQIPWHVTALLTPALLLFAISIPGFFIGVILRIYGATHLALWCRKHDPAEWSIVAPLALDERFGRWSVRAMDPNRIVLENQFFSPWARYVVIWGICSYMTFTVTFAVVHGVQQTNQGTPVGIAIVASFISVLIWGAILLAALKSQIRQRIILTIDTPSPNSPPLVSCTLERNYHPLLPSRRRHLDLRDMAAGVHWANRDVPPELGLFINAPARNAMGVPEPILNMKGFAKGYFGLWQAARLNHLFRSLGASER